MIGYLTVKPEIDTNPRLIRRYLTVLAVMLCFGGINYLFPQMTNAPMRLFLLNDPGQTWALAELVRDEGRPWRDITQHPVPFYNLEPVVRWFRVEFPPSMDPAKRDYVVELSHPFYCQVEFSLVEGGPQHKVLKSELSGQMLSIFDRSYPSFYHVFRFTAPPEGGNVYLRTLTLDNPNQGHIRFTLASDYERFVKIRSFVLGIFVGGCLSLVIYNLFVYLSLRHRPHLYYVIYQLSALVALCIYTGPLTAIWPQGIGPNIPYRLLMAAAILAVFMFVCFANALLLSVGSQTRREAMALNIGYVLIATEALIIPFMAPTVLFFGFIAILALWVPVMTVIHAKKIRHDRIYYMFLGIAVLITGIVGPTLANVGLLPFTALVSQMYYISALIEGILVSMALAHQIRALQWERHAILDAISSDQSRGQGDHAIDQLIGSSLRVTQRVAEHELSVMFVDTANFSRLAATAPNAQVLRDLSRQIRAIHTAVEAHHGVVDRSLGDGVLAVFGYENKRGLPLNARDAFDAAVAIQTAAVEGANDHHSEDRLVFPLRIGINTAPVLVGNLGGRGRIDFTMIGEGVNFARRLEASASPFNIVLSEATMSALHASAVAPRGFGDMRLKVKHRDDFIKAFEFNPFSDRAELLARAKSACMARLGMKREEQRLVVSGDPEGWLMSEIGRLDIVDFSRHGLCVAANMLLGQKATFLCSFETRHQSVAARLDELLATEFMVEVRWSRSGTQGYVSGLRFVGLNDALTDFIFESMCTAHGLTQLRGELPEADEPPAA